jgi:hypothetical protein
MKRLKKVLGALAVAALVVGHVPSAPAQERDPGVAESPERIAKRCIERAEDVGASCERSIVRTTKRCIRVVKRLVEAGEIERAERVAATCEERIVEKARRCTTNIEKHCVRCVRHLDELGEPELAERVKEACAAVIDGIVDLVERALAALADALGGGGGALDEAA